MRETKFFGIAVACVVVLLLAVFATWAKPPWAGTKTKAGYARLTDEVSYVIEGCP